MKIKIAYLPEEENLAHRVVQVLRCVMDDPKVKERCQHPPFHHIYLTSKSKSNACILLDNMVE